MSSIPQLPKEIFDSLHPAAQIYIRHLEETILVQQETIRKQEIRIQQLEISTARKQGWCVWDALTDALRGRPRLLSVPGS